MNHFQCVHQLLLQISSFTALHPAYPPSLLGMLSSSLKGPLQAMLFQSIYVQVPTTRLGKGSVPGGSSSLGVKLCKRTTGADLGVLFFSSLSLSFFGWSLLSLQSRESPLQAPSLIAHEDPQLDVSMDVRRNAALLPRHKRKLSTGFRCVAAAAAVSDLSQSPRKKNAGCASGRGERQNSSAAAVVCSGINSCAQLA